MSPSDFIKDKHNVLWIPLLDGTIGKFFLLEVVVYICLAQYVTDVMKFAAALSHGATHRIEGGLMMNPSSDVCKKCLIVGHLRTK